MTVTLVRILTIINIMSGTAAMYCLLLTMHNYVIGKWMKNYIFLLFATMALLVLSQFLMIVSDYEPYWQAKLIGLFLSYESIYFAWAIRFTSLKKDRSKSGHVTHSTGESEKIRDEATE